MSDATDKWFLRHKMLIILAVFALILLLTILANSNDRNPPSESSNTGVSSGVNDGEKAITPTD